MVTGEWVPTQYPCVGDMSIHKWVFLDKKIPQPNRKQTAATYRYLKSPEIRPTKKAQTMAMMRVAGMAAKDALTKNATMEPKGMRMSVTIT